VCPWHRYEFDLATGRCVADPARLRVATYRIEVEGDEIAVYV
jgi:nitrite reductase/ring-hydroxylating ferredoxin subunit